MLLIQRKNEPFKHKWAFPGGFVGVNEKLVKAYQRELKEETNLHIKLNQFEFLNIFDDIHRDPRSRTISIAFTCLINKKVDAVARDDAALAKWFKLDRVNTNDLAFDHSKILDLAKKHHHLH